MLLLYLAQYVLIRKQYAEIPTFVKETAALLAAAMVITMILRPDGLSWSGILAMLVFALFAGFKLYHAVQRFRAVWQ
jgi:hypothetical protein